MTDRTAAARNAALRQRERAAGLTRKTVVVPAARAAELDAIVQQWRDEYAVSSTLAQIAGA